METKALHVPTTMARTADRFQLINGETFRLIDTVNDALLMGGITHLHAEGFRWIEVPTLTKITGACENVDSLYAVDHFGQEGYLAQTGQLYLEAKIPSHKKVWTLMTSSRAEASNDDRHVNQFQLLEFEHEGDLSSLLDNIESTIQAMVRNAIETTGDELRTLGRDMGHLASYLEPFQRITYTEAVNMLEEFGVIWGDDLKADHEKYLVEQFGDKPLFVTHYPRRIKFFNMRTNRQNPAVVNSADLLLPFSGESVGSAERENDHTHLVKKLEESDMFKILERRGKTLDDFQDYLVLIRKHPILHAGCGIGFTRVSQSVLGFPDIRMATNYPIQSDVLY